MRLRLDLIRDSITAARIVARSHALCWLADCLRAPSSDGCRSGSRCPDVASHRGTVITPRGPLAEDLVIMRAGSARDVFLHLRISGHAEQAGHRDQGCHKPAVQHMLTHCLPSDARTIGPEGNHWMSRNASPRTGDVTNGQAWENGFRQPSAGTAFGLPSPSSATMTKSAWVTFSIRSER
jgi:hypothetical protein